MISNTRIAVIGLDMLPAKDYLQQNIRLLDINQSRINDYFPVRIVLLKFRKKQASTFR
jgi:S-adenosylmethionine synthetase